MGTPKFKIDFDYKVAIILWGGNTQLLYFSLVYKKQWH